MRIELLTIKYIISVVQWRLTPLGCMLPYPRTLRGLLFIIFLEVFLRFLDFLFSALGLQEPQKEPSENGQINL